MLCPWVVLSSTGDKLIMDHIPHSFFTVQLSSIQFMFKIILHSFHIVGRLTFFSKFEGSSYSKSLCKHSQI
jgi:hypothetical protein